MSFIKVHSFDFDNNSNNNGNHADYEYYQLELDINALAAVKGLPLTNQFVIRFQQHDDGDFSNGGIGTDGYVLDDFQVTDTSPVSDLNDLTRTLLAYPNPATDHIIIERQGVNALQPAKFRLLDMTGRVLHLGTLSSARETLNMSTLPSGWLLLEVEEEGIVARRRFVHNAVKT